MAPSEGFVRDYVHCEVTLEPDLGREYLTVRWRLGEADVPTRRSRAPLASELIGTLRKHGEGPPDEDAAEQVGRAVFDALTPGETRERLVALLRETLESGRGARIAILCPRALDRVPWELMWSREYGHLALVDRISIVRRSGGAPSFDPVARTLNFHYVDGGTSDEAAHALADSVCGPRTGIPQSLMAREPDDPGVARWAGVRRELQATAPTVFHFTGPGTPAFGSREARLQFAGAVDTDRVARRSLAAELTNSGIVLAVLATRYPGVDDHWDGIGADLVAGGVPTVVSIPARLGEAAKEVFVDELYRRLYAEASVDDAVACGRRAVHDAGPAEWWLPILHSDAANGIRFESPHPPPEVPQRPVLRRTRNAVPMHGDPPDLWTPAGLPAGVHDRPVLSANGRLCAVAATGGTIIVGIVSIGEKVHWWRPVAAGPGTRVVAVHNYPYHAEVLVSSRDGTRRLQVDNGGGVHVEMQSWKQEAVSGAWVGTGFVWIDSMGSVQPYDMCTSVPFGMGCRLVDAAVGEGHRLVSWVRENELGMFLVDLDASSAGEIRTTPIDVVPNDLIVARNPTRIPSTTVLTVGEKLMWWTWDDLAPATAGPPERDVSHES